MHDSCIIVEILCFEQSGDCLSVRYTAKLLIVPVCAFDREGRVAEQKTMNTSSMLPLSDRSSEPDGGGARLAGLDASASTLVSLQHVNEHFSLFRRVLARALFFSALGGGRKQTLGCWKKLSIRKT